MIVAADKLIEHIEATYHVRVHDICCLDKSCVKTKRCSVNHGIQILDFDKVKDARCKGGNPLPSVDGLLEQNGFLCFVELKSWENYLKYQSPESEKDIQAQLDDYNLEGKLTQSMIMCQEEADNSLLFEEIPVLFALVTDIDVDRTGERDILLKLNMLAHSASDWRTVCNRLSEEKLKGMSVKTVYYSCKNFDKELLADIAVLCNK